VNVKAVEAKETKTTFLLNVSLK